MELELITDYACVCGENPLWHSGEMCVYWTDIPAGRLFRYDPIKGTHEICYEGDVIGGFTLQADGALLLFMARGAIKLWRGGALTTIVTQIPDERESRFNDVIADPIGRVYCGTMPTSERLGRLYRLDTDGALTLLLEGIGCSNGLGFTPDRKGLYYTDSRSREIALFDYDLRTGDIAHRRLFATNPEREGLPDGMTVDAEGYVWSARWNGGCLVRLAPDPDRAPDRREVQRIPFPARKVSSVVFGGPDCTDLYVTTAGGNKKATEGDGAGALFRLHPGVRGVPEFMSRIGLTRTNLSVPA